MIVGCCVFWNVRVDIATVTAAFAKGGKDWVMLGWRADERAFALDLSWPPAMIVVGPQYGIICVGFDLLN